MSCHNINFDFPNLTTALRIGEQVHSTQNPINNKFYKLNGTQYSLVRVCTRRIMYRDQNIIHIQSLLPKQP